MKTCSHDRFKKIEEVINERKEYHEKVVEFLKKNEERNQRKEERAERKELLEKKKLELLELLINKSN